MRFVHHLRKNEGYSVIDCYGGDYQTALITIRWRLFDYTEEIGKDHPYYKQLRGYVDGLTELACTINGVTAMHKNKNLEGEI